jgi:two-component system invasion response regulator UvrY
MIRILVVDDHPVVRRGICQILTSHFDEAIIGEADDAASGVAKASTDEWDVVLLDVSLPGQTGLDALKQIHKQRPTLPILVLSIHPANQFAHRALSAGGLGYLTKDCAATELVDAIEEVRRGRRYVSPTVLDAAASSGGRVGAHEALSDREYQVLRMLGSGRTVSEIAREHGLSVKTVSTYRARVLEKLGMRTTAELMRYAIENGLLES